MFHGSIPAEDLEKDAECLGITKEEFMDSFLSLEKIEEAYQTKHRPCDFLQEDGNCKLGDCRPENCKNYPYTNQSERLWSLYSVLDAVEACPVAYEI